MTSRSFAFDAEYYRRYYEDPKTRIYDRARHAHLIEGVLGLLSWFGWPVRTFEAAVKPGALGWNWAMFAFRGWQRLSWLDENVLSRVVPDELFYNVSITGTKPLD